MCAACAIERSGRNVRCGMARSRSRASQLRMNPRAPSSAWSEARHSASDPSTLT